MSLLLLRVSTNFMTSTLKMGPSLSTKSSQDSLHHFSKVLGLAMEWFLYDDNYIRKC